MLTRTQAQSTLLHTPDARTPEGHKPPVFEVEASWAAKVDFLVSHLTTVSAQNLALEQLRRGTKIAKIDRALGQVHEAISLASIASGEFVAR